MEDELIDVINEKNEVIDIEKKSVVLEKNLLRRVVHIMIFNKENKILMQKRGNVKPSPGKWTSSASGHVSSGEDYFSAAKRELKEEIGIDVPLKFDGYFRGNPPASNVIGALFTGNYDGKFKVDNNEVESIQLFDIDSLKIAIRNNPNIFSSNFKEAFKLYCRENGE